MDRIGMVVRRAVRAAVATGLLALASCGGGDTLEPFNPKRIIVFGDEQSIVHPTAKFSVNFVDATTLTPDCERLPVWTQVAALSFGLRFAECPGTATTTQGLLYAEADRKVADLAAQIDQHLAVSTFEETDLITVFIGLHDVLELYGSFPGTGRDALLAEAEVRGEALANQVNRIAEAGGRVLFVTLQDLSLSPFGLSQQTVGADRLLLLRDLTSAFNLSLKLNVINDGRRLGLVALDGLTQDIVRNPGANGFSNVTQEVCDPVPLNQCTTQTLVDNGDALTFLWADGTRLSAGAHNLLGIAAQERARRNPF